MSKLLVVFGSTGATGKEIVRLALEAGLRVRAYARAPEKLPEDLAQHPNLEVAKGDFADSEAIQAAIEGSDFVVCAAGNAQASKQSMVMLDLVQDIVDGMKRHGTRRFLYQAGAFSPAHGQRLPPMVGWLMRPVMGGVMGISGMLRDNDAVIEFLHGQAADLDWTVTRPGMLKDQPSKGPVKASEKMGGAVHFVDLAQFTVDTVQGDDQVHACPYITY